MPLVITAPEIPETTSPASADDDVEPLSLLLPSALRSRAFHAETALNVLARDYPDLHLQAMAWLG
jgi:hypothetical protein